MESVVSIVVPVYNVTNYIEQCLHSLVNQTLKDIEIIIVDDCGTDDSISKVEAFAKRDSRIRIIHNVTNQGVAESRNIGLRYVTSQYVAFLDSDDYVALDFYEKLYREAKRNNADIAVGKTLYYYEKKGVCKEQWVSRWNFYTGSRVAVKPEEKQYNIYACACWDKIYKTELFRANGISFPKGLLIEDVPVTFISVALANKIILVPDAKLFYRQRNDSIMKNLQNNRRVLDVFAIYEYTDQILANSNIQNKDAYNKILDNFKIFNLNSWLNGTKGSLYVEFESRLKEVFGRIELSDNPFITPESRDTYHRLVHGECLLSETQYKFCGCLPVLKISKTNFKTCYKIFNTIPLLTLKKGSGRTDCLVFGLPFLTIKFH